MKNRLPALLLLLSLGLAVPAAARAQSLATRRLIETAKTEQLPGAEKSLAEKTGAKIPIEVDFASLGDDAAAFDGLRITLNRLVSAFEDEAKDKLGKEAVAAKVKKVAISKAADDSAELKDGTLTVKGRMTDQSTLTIGGIIEKGLEKGL